MALGIIRTTSGEAEPVNVEDILNAVSLFAGEQYARRATRIRIDLDDGTKIDLPVPPKREAVQPVGDEKKVNATREPVNEEEENVEAAIITVLMDAETRLTGGVLFPKLKNEHLDELGFGERNLQRVAAKLVKEGEIVNYSKDPGDGMGRGYGMPK